MDTFGGEFNAFTGEEYAGYYVKSAPEHTMKALDMLADMMVNPVFPIEEMEREKLVVIQELKMYEDRPDRQAYDKFKRYMYGDTSYGWEIIGPEENIRKFTQEDLFNHKHSLYTKDNMLIVIAGKIEHQTEIEAGIATLFAEIPEKKTVEKPRFVPHVPAQQTTSHVK
ncbi:insulinase family protein [Patescibacteria group bacterium]|nr:insulinase family protein [Patescibacteria group bacterium]